jgi:hypothetical protein
MDGFNITDGVPTKWSGASQGTALRPGCVEGQSLTAIAPGIGEEWGEVLNGILPGALVHGGVGENKQTVGFMSC